MFEKKFILGVGFNNAPENLILEYIVKSVEKSTEKYYVVTPNPELLVISHNSIEYKKILNKAKLALPDGVGVILASKLLRKGIKERITGVDLVNKLCRAVAEKPITVGFLGGGPGIADKTAECLTQKYPGLKVVFVQEEWPKEIIVRGPVTRFPPASARSSLSSSNELRAVGSPSTRATPNFKKLSNISISQYLNIDILFVAFGSPKQELWISKNLNKLPIKVAIGVGGAFDFISGEVRRAPIWIRKIGFEWLFRLIIQPWRIKRQLSLIYFIILILKEKFFSKL